MEATIKFTQLPDIDVDSSLTALEEGQTIIHCIYTASEKYINGGWVNIWPTTYLLHSATSERLQMLFALNVPVSPAKHYFKSVGQKLHFILIFPKLPVNWNSFHLQEVAGQNNGFLVKNIKREDSGIHRVFIH